MANTLLDNFEEIVYAKPADIIINQIKNLITSGQLKPGEKLPPERKLSEKLSVSRSAVRDAIKKLEFYGILKTHPQSGTVVAGIGITALQGLLTDILSVDARDFKSLVETRVILEVNSARFAAERRTDEDIIKIQQALDLYREQQQLGNPTVEEDLRFHLEIANASKKLRVEIVDDGDYPDIISNFIKYDVCGEDVKAARFGEHQLLLDHIINQNPDKAAQAMENHLRDIKAFSISTDNQSI